MRFSIAQGELASLSIRYPGNATHDLYSTSMVICILFDEDLETKDCCCPFPPRPVRVLHLSVRTLGSDMILDNMH